jgi:inorganic phosphate transporter, PiT family
VPPAGRTGAWAAPTPDGGTVSGRPAGPTPPLHPAHYGVVELSLALPLVVLLALAFDLTNGFHDSSNSLAAPVATRAMTPRQALAVTTLFTLLGPILAGTAVADTVGGLIQVGTDDILGILLAALVAAVTWNLLTWRFGLPSSSSHALVGGLVGAAMVTGGVTSVNWGGFDGWRPVGVAGVLVALAVSPLLGALAGWLMDTSARRGLRRADQRVTSSLKRGQWGTSAALAFAHGTNDAQKTMGLITLALVAAGSLTTFVVPLWVKVACGAAMTFGTALGGWRIVRTLGRGIYRIRPLDGLASQGSSTLVIGGAAMLGAPVSTTHVVASSVVGVGAARRRRHVRWPVVREILLAWLVTMPGCATMAAAVALLEGVLR